MARAEDMMMREVLAGCSSVTRKAFGGSNDEDINTRTRGVRGVSRDVRELLVEATMGISILDKVHRAKLRISA